MGLTAAPVLAGASAACRTHAGEAGPVQQLGPLIDWHVHLDNSTLSRVLELSRQRGIKFGIVEHAGTKENKYPVVLSNDAELKAYIERFGDAPVYKGIQAEWTDWMNCFSRAALAQLDYVLTDTMTFPRKTGERMKLWERGADIGDDPEAFMDKYVDWHLQIMSRQPIDLLANTSWLPGSMASDYEKFWTAARIRKVVDAAVEYRVAFEISSSFKLPKPKFLQTAKAAGVKFCFGSNGRYPNMGKLDYSLEMAKALDLKPGDLFKAPGPGQKAVERRKWFQDR